MFSKILEYIKNIEYLMPLFCGMPDWIRILFISWFLFSVIVFGIIGHNFYIQNKINSHKFKFYKIEKVKLQLNREIEDLKNKIKEITDPFPNEKAKIVAKNQHKGSYLQPQQLKQLITPIANQYIQKLNQAKIDTTRKIEDILLENFNIKDISALDAFKIENEEYNNTIELLNSKISSIKSKIF